MSECKKVVIITDDNAAIRQTAENIAAIINGCSGYQAASMKAEDFSGVELLPSCAFFLGCEGPEPSSFSYIKDMLEHINLAGRPCGIFASAPNALKYLSTLVHASEANVKKLLTSKLDTPQELQNWVQGILGTGNA